MAARVLETLGADPSKIRTQVRWCAAASSSSCSYGSSVSSAPCQSSCSSTIVKEGFRQGSWSAAGTRPPSAV